MKINLNIIIYILLLSSMALSQIKEYKLSTLDKNKIKQAKALEKNGQFDDAEYIYKDMLSTSPYIKEACIPLKKIYLNKNNPNSFIEFADKYLESHNNHYSKQLEIIDVYIMANHPKLESIINEIMLQEFSNKFIRIKPLLKNLIYNNHITKANNIIDDIRENSQYKNYYALELATYYSLQFKYGQSIKEYLLYVEYNPKTLDYVSNRIMSLSDYPNTINIIQEELNSSKLEEAKIILSNLEFKLKNYDNSYNILLEINDEKHIISFIKELLKIENFDFAQLVITNTLNTSTNQLILNAAVFELAQLCEIKMQDNQIDLLITYEINNNQLLSNSFIKFDSTYNNLLNKAIFIYDSLRIKSNDFISTYHLADIKYKIQNDFDGAFELYNNVYKYSKDSEYKQFALSRLIDVSIASGNMPQAKNIINNNLKDTKDMEIIRDIKSAQIEFYDGDRDSTIKNCKLLLAEISNKHQYYNDILDILSISYLCDNNEDFEKYSTIKLKLFQNSIVEAIELLKNTTLKNKEAQNLINYELAYANFLMDQFSESIKLINNISESSIYKEYGIILKSEIYDFKLNDNIEAINSYNEFLDLFTNSIYYETIRLRLRELINKELDL